MTRAQRFRLKSDLSAFRVLYIPYDRWYDTLRGRSQPAGALHLMVQRLGLVEEINRHLQLLKVHLPYHESDHVLNISYNLLAGGVRLEDIEQRRQDENFLNGLEAQRIPDPTTAGDFTRRFAEADTRRRRMGTTSALLSRLEDQRHCARPVRIASEQCRRTEQRGRVPVMPTSVHHAGHGGTIQPGKGVWGRADARRQQKERRHRLSKVADAGGSLGRVLRTDFCFDRI